MPSTISAGTTAGTAIAIAGDTTGNLAFQTNGTTTAMTITTSQNVGIGTTSPNQTLQVNGNIMSGNGSAANPGYNFVASSATGMFTPDGFVVAFSANGTEAGRFNSSGNFLFNSGYGSVATAYGCRAWVTFNGSDTPTIRASGNVSSITDFGIGDYRINFTTNMVDTNYTIVGSSIKAGGAPSGDNSAVVIMGESPSVSGAGVGILTVNGGALDRGYVYAAVFR